MTAGASRAELTITLQPALAPSPQPRPAPTGRALIVRNVGKGGPFWMPIRGPDWMPIDRQRTARRPPPFEARHCNLRALGCELCRRLGFGRIRFELGQLELQLLKHGAALRGLAVLLVPALGDLVLQLLDL